MVEDFVELGPSVGVLAAIATLLAQTPVDAAKIVQLEK